MNPTNKQKRILKRFLAEAWPKINAVAIESGDGSDGIASTKETHRNYFAWCRRHRLDPEDHRCFATYFGLFSPSEGRIKTKPISLALFEQRYGSGISSLPELRSTWNLSLTAQVIEWDRLEKRSGDFCQRLREGKENVHEYFPARRCKVIVRTEIILPENTRRPFSPFIPQDRFQVKWEFSVPHHQRRRSRNAVDIIVRPHAYATLDSVFTDLLVGLFGINFFPHKGREVRTTIQPYRYRNKKSIDKCIKFEQKRGKYRSTEPHY